MVRIKNKVSGIVIHYQDDYNDPEYMLNDLFLLRLLITIQKSTKVMGSIKKM